MGEFEGPIKRRSSWIWGFRPGRSESSSSKERGSLSPDEDGSAAGQGTDGGDSGEVFEGVTADDLVIRRVGVRRIISSSVMVGSDLFSVVAAAAGNRREKKNPNNPSKLQKEGKSRELLLKNK